MASKNQLVDGSFMNTAGYNAGQAPVAAPVTSLPAASQGSFMDTAGYNAASTPVAGQVDVNVNNTPAFTAAVTPVTPTSTSTPSGGGGGGGFTQADIDAAVAKALTAANAANAANAAAAKAASITNAATQATAVLAGYGLTGDIANGITAMMQNGLDMTTITNILDSSNPTTAIQGLGLSSAQLASATSLVGAWQTRFQATKPVSLLVLTHLILLLTLPTSSHTSR